ncbi:hypothetical protein Scep_016719 [Stephania cephalantha]|uniref:Uncharacterized protein n=1 Tax=Stephania cephalantha TaxID=152367 RepID=A0AAP0IN88_9MAGN
MDAPVANPFHSSQPPNLDSELVAQPYDPVPRSSEIHLPALALYFSLRSIMDHEVHAFVAGACTTTLQNCREESSACLRSRGKQQFYYHYWLSIISSVVSRGTTELLIMQKSFSEIQKKAHIILLAFTYCTRHFRVDDLSADLHKSKGKALVNGDLSEDS